MSEPVLMRELRAQGELYEEDTARLRALLGAIGVGEGDLPATLRSDLRDLSMAAVALGADCGTPSRIACALVAAEIDGAEARLDLAEQRGRAERLQAARREHEGALGALRGDWAREMERRYAATQEGDSRDRAAAVYCTTKAGEYAKVSATMQQKLARSGYGEDICHGEVVKLKHKLREAQSQLKPLLDELNTYHNLPTNYSEAQVTVEQLKQDILNLKQQLEANVSDFM
ncbi:hypothetical protein Pelo_3289 [Pelomyxa schiedti]|nr:hypothetical protein Pelo_3289 [Pelomyxa schiedti]